MYKVFGIDLILLTLWVAVWVCCSWVDDMFHLGFIVMCVHGVMCVDVAMVMSHHVDVIMACFWLLSPRVGSEIGYLHHTCLAVIGPHPLGMPYLVCSLWWHQSGLAWWSNSQSHSHSGLVDHTETYLVLKTGHGISTQSLERAGLWRIRSIRLGSLKHCISVT